MIPRKPGRKSAASLTLVPLVPRPRMEPAKGMPAAVAKIFRRTVESVEADWFDEGSRPLLVAYCRHVHDSERLAKMIEASPPPSDGPEALKRYADLLRMRDREDRATVALARSMRLTQGSRFRRETAGSRHGGGSAAGPKPWEAS